ncbi:hypothetical protein D3C72_937020 [compost metagenome]
MAFCSRSTLTGFIYQIYNLACPDIDSTFTNHHHLIASVRSFPQFFPARTPRPGDKQGTAAVTSSDTMILILWNVYQTASVSIKPDNLTVTLYDFFDVVAFQQQTERPKCMGMESVLVTS